MRVRKIQGFIILLINYESIISLINNETLMICNRKATLIGRSKNYTNNFYIYDKKEIKAFNELTSNFRFDNF